MTIRVVADTHAILWYLYNDARLSSTANTLMDAIDIVSQSFLLLVGFL